MSGTSCEKGAISNKVIIGIAAGVILIIVIAAILIWYILHVKKSNKALPLEVGSPKWAGSPRDAVELDEGSQNSPVKAGSPWCAIDFDEKITPKPGAFVGSPWCAIDLDEKTTPKPGTLVGSP